MSLVSDYLRMVISAEGGNAALVFADLGFEEGKAYGTLSVNNKKLLRNRRFYFCFEGKLYKGYIRVDEDYFRYRRSSRTGSYLYRYNEIVEAYYHPVNCIEISMSEESLNTLLDIKFVEVKLFELMTPEKVKNFNEICEEFNLNPADLENWYDAVYYARHNTFDGVHNDCGIFDLAYHPDL